MPRGPEPRYPPLFQMTGKDGQGAPGAARQSAMGSRMTTAVSVGRRFA
jgi:hypothetical protein